MATRVADKFRRAGNLRRSDSDTCIQLLESSVRVESELAESATASASDTAAGSTDERAEMQAAVSVDNSLVESLSERGGHRTESVMSRAANLLHMPKVPVFSGWKKSGKRPERVPEAVVLPHCKSCDQEADKASHFCAGCGALGASAGATAAQDDSCTADMAVSLRTQLAVRASERMRRSNSDPQLPAQSHDPDSEHLAALTGASRDKLVLKHKGVQMEPDQATPAPISGDETDSKNERHLAPPVSEDGNAAKKGSSKFGLRMPWSRVGKKPECLITETV